MFGRSCFAFLAMAMGLPACDDGMSAMQADAAHQDPPLDAARVPLPAEGGSNVAPFGYRGKTTDPGMAVGNLNAQAEGFESALRINPSNLFVRSAWLDTLLSRTAFLGTYDDFTRALEGATTWPKEDDDGGRRARARAFNAVHRFSEALAELSTLSSPSLEAEALQETIHIATGRNLVNVHLARRARAAAHPSFETLSDAAASAAALGRHEEAHGLYQASLEAYRDTSPFPVAFVFFQLGVMWGEMANRPDLARPLYAEAVRVLPQYVVANVHLAELEAGEGPEGLAQALERLRRIASATMDPEPSGLLGELLSATGSAEGAAFIARAAASYRTLLSRHRAAFSDHAAEFFAGPGQDPAFALELALENVRNRATSRAFVVGIEAALAAAQVTVACDLVRQAPTLEVITENLRVLLVETTPRCP